MKKIVIVAFAAMMAFAGTAAASAAAVSETAVSTVAKKPKAELKTVTFKSSIHCKNCAKKVEENIAFEKGVKALEVSVEDKTIKVTYDASKTSEETLAAAIRKLGYTAEKVK